MKLPKGDRQQISELRGQWEYYFNKKNEFLNRIAKRALNADQKLEAEMYLIELTGTIKSIDRKIHNIMFGASERVEERPYSLEYLVRKNVTRNETAWKAINGSLMEIINAQNLTIAGLQSRVKTAHKKLPKGKHKNYLSKKAA